MAWMLSFAAMWLSFDIEYECVRCRGRQLKYCQQNRRRRAGG